MISRAAIAAEAPASVEDGAVWQEEAGRVVVPWDGDGSHLSEGLGSWVPELRDQLWGLICETDSVVLTAGDEDFSVGKDKAVMEGTGISHRIYPCYFWSGIGIADGNYVRVGC